jgi:hypothetical protein
MALVALAPASVARDLPDGIVAAAIADPSEQIETSIIWRADDSSPINRAFRETAVSAGHRLERSTPVGAGLAARKAG